MSPSLWVLEFSTSVISCFAYTVVPFLGSCFNTAYCVVKWNKNTARNIPLTFSSLLGFSWNTFLLIYRKFHGGIVTPSFMEKNNSQHYASRKYHREIIVTIEWSILMNLHTIELQFHWIFFLTTAMTFIALSSSKMIVVYVSENHISTYLKKCVD